MKKMVFIAFALMIVAATAAMAGTDLAWNDCQSSGLGANTRANACANSGSAIMFIGENPAVDFPNLAATDAYIDVQAVSSISTFWLTSPIGTRWGSSNGEPASGACLGWWQTAPNGPIVFQPVLAGGGPISPSRIRLRVTAVIAAGEEQLVTAGTEWFCGSLSLKFNAGSATNAECIAGAAIGIVNIDCSEPPNTVIPDQVADVGNCLTFHASTAPACPGATPTKKATWGSIKALYR